MDPQMKKKKRSFRVFFGVIAFLLIVIVGAIAIGTTWYNDAIFNQNSSSADGVDFVVNPGDTLVGIADDLQEKGLIKNKDALRIYLRLNNLSPALKIGNYTISKNLTVPQLIEILEQGVYKQAVWVTIPEGLRDGEVADIIDEKLGEDESSKIFSKESFLQIVNKPDDTVFSNDIATFLINAKPAGKPLTGFLYPDTYRVDVDATSQEVIEMLLKNFRDKMNEAQIDTGNVVVPNLKNFYEALSLASIIQVEAGHADDKPVISSIFHNRLKVNYPLQSDVTINFALNKNTLLVTYRDLEVDSPYNTYKYTGVTPTPISNPDINSIKAAISPKDTNLFYFLYDEKGDFYTAETFAQHQANVDRYLNN